MARHWEMGIMAQRMIDGLSVRLEGDGPLVVLMHGWPELGLSWRHQVPALVEAGYRVAVPDMPGYGQSAKPEDIAAYTLDRLADRMQALAASLGAARWVAVGHDWGAPVAWRCALRFADNVAGVFALSVPHSAPPPIPFFDIIDAVFPDRFFYMRYFQQPGVAEAEFARADMVAALKAIFYGASFEGVARHRPRHVPRDSTLLASMDPPPSGPLTFMTDVELEAYAAAFRAGGMQGPLNWYRNFDRNAADARAYGDNIVRQPAGFLAGDREVVLAMLPGQLENMRKLCADLRSEISLPGAGHWVQQERPPEVTQALITFLSAVQYS
jgi:pimeloyl-ACP methyl ester carboxylesterase